MQPCTVSKTKQKTQFEDHIQKKNEYWSVRRIGRKLDLELRQQKEEKVIFSTTF